MACKPTTSGRASAPPTISIAHVSSRVSRTALRAQVRAAVQTAQSQRATTTGTPPARSRPPKSSGSSGQFYLNITGFPFPLAPTFQRKTVRTEVLKDTIWTFEQMQGLELGFDVFTPVRMTVIKLKTGGLWVHAPVAPTDECIRLLKELDAPVEYIVLPTFAYEHKVFVGPFSRRFPKAKVYVAPYQWSFPFNLPNQFFGIFPAGYLDGQDDAPWSDEIEQKLFLPPSIGVSNAVRFCEVAFYHKKSRTMLVTDSVVYVTEKPSEAIPASALLENARDNFLARFVAGARTKAEVEQQARPERVDDTPENRRRGWKRMSLLALYFGPFDLFRPDASFSAISNRLMVAPVVETLVYSKTPISIREWVDSIIRDWKFTTIIPAHFAAPVRAGPADFKRAFAFAYQDESPPAGPVGSLLALLPGGGGGKPSRSVVFPPEDLKTLTNLNESLLRLGVVKANADAS